MKKQLILLCFVCSVLTANAFKNDSIIVITNANPNQMVGTYSKIFEDKSGALTLEEVSNPTFNSYFTEFSGNIFNFANTRSAIWIKFSVQNMTEKSILVAVDKNLIHYVDFYLSDSSKSIATFKTGALLPFKTRDFEDNIFLFRVSEPGDRSLHHVLIRLKSDDPIEVPIFAGTNESFYVRNSITEYWYGIYFGIMIVMLTYNLFLFFFMREKIYLYYCLCLFFFVLMNDIMACGYGFQYIWPELPEINYYINAYIGVLIIWIVVFTRSFLGTRQVIPNWDKSLILIVALAVLTIVTNLLDYYFLSSILSQILGLLTCLFMLAIGLASLNRGVIIAKFYLMAWGTSLAMTIVFIIYLNGFLPYSYITQNATLIGSALESVLLALALGHRIGLLKKEKQKIQEQLIQVEIDQKKLLQNKVQERTDEITTQNEALVTQQEQIKIQNEALEAKNEKLRLAQETIEKQNNELRFYNDNLEHQVTERADELQKANTELSERNNQLEQYGYIIAHNLRAPVARIRGLTQVFDFNVPENPDNKYILESLSNVSGELDNVIHDLNHILEVKTGRNVLFKEVNLEDHFNKAIKTVQEELDQFNFKVEKHFYQKTLTCVPHYVDSIFYNFLQNSIKYRHEAIKPRIVLKTELIDNNMVLSFEDNGIGIDLEKFGHKIFGLYQRFHVHIEGKGLGLHLVKNQVEAMGGQIKVESNVGLGTKFTLNFKIEA